MAMPPMKGLITVASLLSLLSLTSSGALLQINGGEAGVYPGGSTPPLSSDTARGFFNSQIAVLDADATTQVRFTFLGGRAHYRNTFQFQGLDIFSNRGDAAVGYDSAEGSEFAEQSAWYSVDSDSLDFGFFVDRRDGNGSVAVNNGENTRQNLSGRAQPNFFASFDETDTRQGTLLTLFLDDAGAEASYDYNDLKIQIEIQSTANSVSQVPLPAALPLFGSALLVYSIGFGLNRQKCSMSDRAG